MKNLLIISAMLMTISLMTSCVSQRNGCPSTRAMSGYHR